MPKDCCCMKLKVAYNNRVLSCPTIIYIYIYWYIWEKNNDKKKSSKKKKKEKTKTYMQWNEYMNIIHPI